MTRKAALAACIWKHMHRDYKAVIDGKRAILMLNRAGATVLAPLAQQPLSDLLRIAPKQCRR